MRNVLKIFKRKRRRAEDIDRQPKGAEAVSSGRRTRRVDVTRGGRVAETSGRPASETR